MSDVVGAYLDFALAPKGIERHHYVRELFALAQHMTAPLFTSAIGRALRYRITNVETIRRIALLIDEIGYVEVEPVQVGLFFTLMQKRHRRKPTLLTSNLGFSEWRTFLKNDHPTAALIDRLTEDSHVINMKNCVSLRPKLKADA